MIGREGVRPKARPGTLRIRAKTSLRSMRSLVRPLPRQCVRRRLAPLKPPDISAGSEEVLSRSIPR